MPRPHAIGGRCPPPSVSPPSESKPRFAFAFNERNAKQKQTAFAIFVQKQTKANGVCFAIWESKPIANGKQTNCKAIAKQKQSSPGLPLLFVCFSFAFRVFAKPRDY